MSRKVLRGVLTGITLCSAVLFAAVEVGGQSGTKNGE
jgi:hypothetical protein